jgi:predicted DCC family thiol-disulfide oxidoreductase YuxK
MLPAVGCVLVALAGLLAGVSLRARAWRSAAATLTAPGPYGHVRNPLTWAWLLLGAGAFLLSGALVVPAVALAGLLLAELWLRPRAEERLEGRFGAAWRRYRQRVWCWRPRPRPYDPAREADEPPLADERTRPPGRVVVLFDGRCRFCDAGSRRLVALARAGAVERVDFQQPGALDRFPGVTHAACMRQMYLVTPDGRVVGGMEAAARALATRRGVGWLAYLYYLPGLRLLLDLLYRLIAANRYRLMGKAVASGGCDGACAVHFGKRPG